MVTDLFWFYFVFLSITNIYLASLNSNDQFQLYELWEK